jgi:hypothetical protein
VPRRTSVYTASSVATLAVLACELKTASNKEAGGMLSIDVVEIEMHGSVVHP